MPPRIRPSPTARVEMSPSHREVLWYKRPREALVKASIKEKTAEVTTARLPKKKETLQVHTHNHARNERQFVLPSTTDLKWILGHPKKTIAIAVREGKPALGYTFVKMRRPNKTRKLKKLVNREPRPYLKYQSQPSTPFSDPKDQKKFTKQIRKSVNKMEKAGLKLRFVANRKREYVFDPKTMQFVRK
ncbi:MAG: hypothetical protein HY544_03150 [Candidatus Diapherotrites archaeon]|uniref:Uncharacterized protein n=1 Tax=Candidatus Iainarchaeum sp. TaxID=3101447 RepID=A0A8T3YKC7_9ARCH|nr:hypothetical protein [Candidatus Diapherotrites archaeon]